MMGTSLPGVSGRGGRFGSPPVSWVIGLAVRLVIDSLARVSVRIGASACSLSRAITARGSLGASFRLSMVPIAMPLYCTLLPLVRPVTGSRKTTSYSRQLLSEEYFEIGRAHV